MTESFKSISRKAQCGYVAFQLYQNILSLDALYLIFPEEIITEMDYLEATYKMLGELIVSAQNLAASNSKMGEKSE